MYNGDGDGVLGSLKWHCSPWWGMLNGSLSDRVVEGIRRLTRHEVVGRWQECQEPVVQEFVHVHGPKEILMSSHPNIK